MDIDLRISAIPPYLWRMHRGSTLNGEWRGIRQRILQRDDYTCRACSIRSMKYMEVHHINGDHRDNRPENLATLCPMCHAVFHVGITGMHRRGILVKSPLPQLDIIRITRIYALFYGSSIRLLEKMHLLGLVEKYGNHRDLMKLADRIHLGWKPPEDYKLFPIPERFRVFRYWKENLHLFEKEREQVERKYPTLFER